MAVNLKYIMRVKRKTASYWLFRFHALGMRREKTFTDQMYGSSDNALKASISFRYKYLKSIDELEMLDKYVSRPTSANVSGIIGVRRAFVRLTGNKYASWQGFGVIESEPWKRSFGIDAHGEKSAFKLACKARYKHNGELTITVPINQLPCSPGVPWKRYKAA